MKYEIIPTPLNIKKIIVECEPKILSDFIQEFETEHTGIKLSVQEVI